MIVSLDRPAHRDEGARPGHLGRQRPDAIGVCTGDLAGPLGGFRYSVGLAPQIRLETIPSVAMGAEKLEVVDPGDEETMGQAEHDRGVGGGPDRDPLRLACLDEVLTQRGDVDEADSSIPTRLQPAGKQVPAEATV